MWEFFTTVWQSLISGSPVAIIAVLLLLLISSGLLIRKLWKERKELLEFVNDQTDKEHEWTEEYLKRYEDLLDRYHNDRHITTKTLGDIKEALAKITGKLF